MPRTPDDMAVGGLVGFDGPLPHGVPERLKLDQVGLMITAEDAQRMYGAALPKLHQMLTDGGGSDGQRQR